MTTSHASTPTSYDSLNANRRQLGPSRLREGFCRAETFAVIDRLSNVVRSMAMHPDQHKVVDCSVLEQSAADNLATIVNGDGEQGIQVPAGASRKECG